jgi:PIN domain nuclease of toxin-antitoxin system
VSYLLDTHALIWLSSRRRTPSADLVASLESGDGAPYVSSVSAFEISTKVRLGKLDEARALSQGWQTLVPEIGARTLDLNNQHALLAGRLDWAHKDPFDRLLAAQAITEGLTLVTADPAFDSAPGLSLLRR